MKLNILLFLWACSLSISTFAQPHTGFDVNKIQIEKQGEGVEIDYQALVRASEITDCESIFLDFFLEKDGHRANLQSLLINGSARTKTYKRSMALHKSQQKLYAATDVVFARKSDVEIPYKHNIPYQDWMSGAVLFVKQTVWSCGGKLETDSFALQTFYEPPVVVQVTDTVTPTEPRIRSGIAYIDFPLASAEFLLELGNNRQEWSKIINEIREIEANQNDKVISIELIGYASPEGPYALNEKLSQKRVQTLAKHVQFITSTPLSPDLVHSSSVAEDWDGLVRLLKENPLPEQEEILHVINTVGIFDGREAALMKIAHGNVFRTLLKDYFPKLRRTEYRITYMRK